MIPSIFSSVSVKILSPLISIAIGSTYSQSHTIFLRAKSNKSKGSQKRIQGDDEGSDSDSEDSIITGKGTEVKTTNVSSMRVDLLLKNGLGIARNKIEEAFYESKIRINSKKILKKSHQVRVGDEVDLIKGTSSTNPLFIIVGRIEVLAAKPRPESEDIQIKLRRSKSLVIDNYPDGDPWRHSEQQQ